MCSEFDLREIPFTGFSMMTVSGKTCVDLARATLTINGLQIKATMDTAQSRLWWRAQSGHAITYNTIAA